MQRWQKRAENHGLTVFRNVGKSGGSQRMISAGY